MTDMRVLWVGPRTLITNVMPGHGVAVSSAESGPLERAASGSVWRRRAALREHDVDLVHLQGRPAVDGWAVPGLLTGLPVVWCLPDEVAQTSDLPRGRPAAVVVHSAASAGLLPRHLPVRVLPPAIEQPDQPAYPTRGPLRALAGRCAGDLTNSQHAFLSAFAAAFPPPSSVRAAMWLTPAGDDGRRRVRSMAFALGVGSRLELVDDPLASRLPPADAFVHVPGGPCTDPRLVLTAMAAGLPVIGTRTSADREVIEHGVSGLLVDPTDASDVTLQLMRLDHDRALRLTLASGGLRRAQQYCPQAAATSLAALYAEVVGKRRHARRGALSSPARRNRR